VAIGQFGMMFAVALFLQDGKHLSAQDNGLWMLPVGISIVAAAPLAGRLVGRFGVPRVIRVGLVIQATGLGYLATSLSVDATFWRVLPGLLGYGIGTGLATSQLTSVILSDIPHAKSGVAGGTNTTARQVGSALGIAVIGAFVTAQASVVTGARHALYFATAVVVIGTFLSLLIPASRPAPPRRIDAANVDLLIGEIG
jgi:predicted MFS family arabinose efflux permease